MITFSTFGYKGRLGNQMFQLSAIISTAKRNNLCFFIPGENVRKIKRCDYEEWCCIGEPFNIPSDWFKTNESISDYNEFKENSLDYSDSIFNIKDKTDLNGFFQSEKYFKNIKDYIINLFNFKTPIIDKCYCFLNNFNKKKFISIHVRRSDYIFNKNIFYLQPPEYYNESVNIIKNNEQYNILIFSDDITWCKNNLKLKNAFFIENMSNYESMCLMTLCNHNIISNSTFSWWGAYLNKNKYKKVIMPSKWYVNGWSSIQYYVDGWIGFP